MCHDPDMPQQELRAAADALHAMLTPSLTPATAPPGGDHSPVAAGASDPNPIEERLR